MRTKGSSTAAGAVVGVLTVGLLLGAAPGDDPLLDRQYHLRKVRAVDAWEAGRGRDQTVAVLDTGVDRDHPDLRGRLVAGIDLVDGGTDTQDENGHGTFVAGIVAANLNNNRGGSGVAPRAKIMPVRVLDKDGRGTSDTVAEGIRWATRAGATIINLSLADVPGQARPPTALITTDVELAIRQAALDGIVVVCAAGNGGQNSTPYTDDLPALIVGATDKRDRVWEHSNYDDRTLFAPGVDIVSTYLDTPYAAADGTSFATPIVSAGAALLRQQGVDPEKARQRLVETARPVGEGQGRVDIAAALGIARRVRTEPSPRPEPRREPRAAQKPREPKPISQPRPVRQREPTVKTPARNPQPVRPAPTVQASPEPKKVAQAERPPAKVRNPKSQRVRKPNATQRQSERALAAPVPAPGPSRPMWPFVVAGGLLLVIIVGLAGWVAARNANSR